MKFDIEYREPLRRDLVSTYEQAIKDIKESKKYSFFKVIASIFVVGVGAALVLTLGIFYAMNAFGPATYQYWAATVSEVMILLSIFGLLLWYNANRDMIDKIDSLEKILKGIRNSTYEIGEVVGAVAYFDPYLSFMNLVINGRVVNVSIIDNNSIVVNGILNNEVVNLYVRTDGISAGNKNNVVYLTSKTVCIDVKNADASEYYVPNVSSIVRKAD